MRPFYFTILLSLISITLFSQASVSGRIIDSLRAPVPYAVVALLQSGDSAIVQGKITDADGLYTFSDVQPGHYFLKVSATGYMDSYSSELSKDSIQDLIVPDLCTGNPLQLSEVTISTITPTIQFTNGNITVNVENSPIARGNSVYDLLSKLPGVGIENNAITIQGKAGVILMIDGRVQQLSNEQLMTILKGMSAATIQKIEILKNPPVKYDAAGTSGMINIVTKRSEARGFNGTFYTETSQGFYNNASSGIELNYKNEKVSIFTGIDGIYNTYLVNTKLYSNFSNDSGNTQLGNETGYRAIEAGPTYKAGLDWYVDKSDIIGFRIDGNQGIYNETGHGKNQVSQQNNLGFDHLLFTEIGHNKWNTWNYNFNAEHRFDTLGTLLDLSADHTSSTENDHSFYSNYFYDVNENEVLTPNIYQNTNDANTQIWSSKLDLTLPIDSASVLESGIKSSLTTMPNDYLFEREDNTTSSFYTDTTLSNNYSYTEKNLAAYFSYSRTFTHFSLKAGVRGEKTFVKGTNSANAFQLRKNYFSLFPNVSFEYSGAADHVFQLNLNRRIDRPSYWDLTPFIVYRDQYSYFSGNPFLQPDFSNTIEFTDIFKELLTTSVSYSHIDHFMLDYTEQNDTTKILLETGKNINYENTISGLLFLKIDPVDWYELEFDVNGSYVSYKGEIRGVPFLTSAFTYRMNLTNTFLLAGKTKLEVTGLYRGPNLFGILRIDPLWSASFAFQRSFCKEKLSCSLGLSDVFNTFKFHTHSQFDNQNWNFYQTSDPRRITLSINYNFGKLNIEERDNSSNDDEKGRLSH